MKPHVKIYMDAFCYGMDDFIPCEIEGCNRRAVDVNHIDCRGMGGSKTKDMIENLMGTCREHHLEFGDKKQYRQMLIDRHFEFMRLCGLSPMEKVD